MSHAFRPLALVGLLAALATIAATAIAAPEPDAVPRRWQLEVEPGDLRITQVRQEDGTVRPYFYFTYTVTNNSGEDVYFAPSFHLYTPDDGELIRSGRDIPYEVTERIIAQLKNEFVQDEINIQGLLLQGEEYAREGVAVWPARNLDVDEIILFASGFSGETKSILRPDTGEKVLLRKTLMLRHLAPGEIDPNQSEPVERTGRGRWILR